MSLGWSAVSQNCSARHHENNAGVARPAAIPAESGSGWGIAYQFATSSSVDGDGFRTFGPSRHVESHSAHGQAVSR
jgi:hypothetical protein